MLWLASASYHRLSPVDMSIRANPRRWLVLEVALAGEHHGDAQLVGGGDRLVVADAAARLDDRDRTVVEGTAELDGDRYEWSGFVRGKVFYGQYRSLKGNNGEFRLEEAK